MSSHHPALTEFVAESKEHLLQLTDDLLALEKSPGRTQRTVIDRMFRAVHTIKGGSQFCGCRTVGTIAAAMEAVLEGLRQDDRRPENACLETLLAAADRTLALLDDVERSDDVDVTSLVARLGAFTGPVEVHDVEVDLAGKTDLVALARAVLAVADVVETRLIPTGNDLASVRLEGPLVWTARLRSRLSAEELGRRTGLPIRGKPAAPPTLPAPPPDEEEPAVRAGERSNTVRLSVELLDRLMTLAGELVLVRNQALRTAEDGPMRPVVHRLNAVTTQLQEAVLQTRMLPVGNLFARFPRLVRDLARQLGKEIELEMDGQSVELDKGILEGLADPLTHLIRNACDHGLESSSIRRAAGKPEPGRLGLRAFPEAGHIRLEVRDDGRGIDPAMVKRKALEKGLRSGAELARLGDREALQVILLPGFSTAERVTDVSGRGVGMDVVKTNLDRLGGHLEIESVVGQGTAFHLRLPLTLAIVPCLLVRCGGERYAIPQKDLVELVLVHDGDGGMRVERAHDQEVCRLRRRLLPLVRLAEVLRRPTAFTAQTRSAIAQGDRLPTPDGPTALAVLKAGGGRFGLLVDEILTTEEVVVKPMHGLLRPLRCYSGATILGDGRVALILDVEGLARHAGAFASGSPPEPTAVAADERETQPVLLFRAGPEEQFAVALALVRRLEVITADRIERVGDREFVTLAGVPTRVLRLDHLLPVSACPPRNEWHLLLPRGVRPPLGVLVSEIVGTERLSIEFSEDGPHQDGLLGTAVIGGRMTLFPDLYRLADRLDPEGASVRRRPPPPGKRRILLVEDTPFFRQLVTGYLEAAGYEVTTAVHGAEGLARLEAEPFDLVVSDIEMPVLDGWSFARAVRASADRSGTPLLALTSLSSNDDRERARACGFDRYEVKVDRESFLTAVLELLGRTGRSGERS